MKTSRTIVLVGAGLWCAAIVVTPLWDVRFLYEFFAKICHQIPNRSWSLGGGNLPVCIRCASIYFGFFLACVFSAKPSFRLLEAAAIATALEFILARLLIDSPWLRSATGLTLGASVAPFVIVGVHDMWKRHGAARAAV